MAPQVAAGACKRLLDVADGVQVVLDLRLVALARHLGGQAGQLLVDEVEQALALGPQPGELGVLARPRAGHAVAEQLRVHLVRIPLGRDLRVRARVDHLGIGGALAREAAAPEPVLHGELQRGEGGLAGRRPAGGDHLIDADCGGGLAHHAHPPGGPQAAEQALVIAGAEGVALQAVEEDHVRLVRPQRLQDGVVTGGQRKVGLGARRPLHRPVLGGVHPVRGEQQHQALRGRGPGRRPAVQRRHERRRRRRDPQRLQQRPPGGGLLVDQARLQQLHWPTFW